jgi:hypothetical protein
MYRELVRSSSEKLTTPRLNCTSLRLPVPLTGITVPDCERRPAPRLEALTNVALAVGVEPSPMPEMRTSSKPKYFCAGLLPPTVVIGLERLLCASHVTSQVVLKLNSSIQASRIGFAKHAFCNVLDGLCCVQCSRVSSLFRCSVAADFMPPGWSDRASRASPRV